MRQHEVLPVSIALERPDAATTAVTVRGEIDYRIYDELKAILTHEVDADHNLIVDLSDVTLLDSTGLGLLVGVLKRAQQRAARTHKEPSRLILVITAREVWRTLEVTNLDHIFAIVERREDADSLI